MLSNLLNTLSFGSVIQQNGKPYTVIMRLTDRLFVGMEQNAKLPTPLMLVQADLQMRPPGGAPSGSGPQGTQAQDAETQKLADAQKQAYTDRIKRTGGVQENKPTLDTAQTEDAAPTGSDKQKDSPEGKPTDPVKNNKTVH